ncbi:MAG: non-reducing end alpha-L-arabinofuranosidase [Actinomycetota bacterium]|nr:non-reducing end alpha-L-arabinofuranosidase [Actinomycetota bacterium]
MQRVPYNGGAAVTSPVALQDTVVTLSNNGTTVPLPHSTAEDAFTVTLLPPSGGPAPSPSPTPPAGGDQQLVGVQSGRCVDVPGATTANGTQVQLFDCGDGAGQAWTYTSGRQLTVYGGAKCLDASGAGTANGTKVIIWDCNGQANQQWSVNADGTITGVPSGLCLDATGVGTVNGTKIVLWTCNGQANQRWTS